MQAVETLLATGSSFGEQVTPPDSNAFPALDLSGVSTETGNWINFMDCGPLGCPVGWRTFEDRFFCSPDGDLALRVFWTPVADCNENGVPDFCEIEDGTRLDTDGNSILDECECPWDLIRIWISSCVRSMRLRRRF